jgi:hypothetical protein
MNLRGHRPSHDVARPIFAEQRRDLRLYRTAMPGLAAVAILAVAGCKTGMNSSLAWWPGASKGAADNEKLASAPSFDGKVEKPSDTQSPYPTTTTPQSYAIDGQKPPSLASAAPPPGSPPTAAGNVPVTYGATPPVASSTPEATATPPSPGTVAAQVGPYQGWPASGSAPAATPPSPPPPSPAGSSAALGFGSASSMTPDALEPPARYADARFSEASAPASSFSSSPSSTTPQPMPAQVVPAQPVPAQPAATVPTSRYATSAASQFGGETPVPVSDVGDPSGFAPQSGVNRLRAPSASAAPSTAPGRRPDPGYRPGGTSTYRPSQAIVDEPADDRPVRQASYDSPLR